MSDPSDEELALEEASARLCALNGLGAEVGQVLARARAELDAIQAEWEPARAAYAKALEKAFLAGVDPAVLERWATPARVERGSP